MSDSIPNLFNALFEFHPRDGHTPKENYLSEAFAYMLTTCDAARDAWLSLALGRRVQAQQCEVTTRQTERNEENIAIFPDMRLTGILDTGELFDLYSEHKWNSACYPGQLQKYLKAVAQGGRKASLAFIGATRRQKREAESSDSRMKGRAFLWADVFQALERVPNKPDLLVQFLHFMKTHGLSPGQRIDSDAMLAFIQSAGFLASLEHCANNLNVDFDWDFLPQRFRNNPDRQVTNKWGRIVVEFTTPAWKPTITVGFLVEEWDHKVAFINRQKGVDLLFRLEAAPRNQQNVAPVLEELVRKRKQLSRLAASVLLHREPGNGNSHSILIMRSCLSDVIEKATTQQAQLEAIYQTVSAWGKVLFSDGALEKALKQAGLDGGMKATASHP